MKVAEQYVQVIVPGPFKEPLTYRVPEELLDLIATGSRVLIPLQRRTVTGIVLQIATKNPALKTKAIIDRLDEAPLFDRNLLDLAQWVARYYLAPIGEVLATLLPPNSRRQSRRTAILKNPNLHGLETRGKKILSELVRRKGKASVKTLGQIFTGQSIHAILAKLESSGAIEIIDHLPKLRRKADVVVSTAAQISDKRRTSFDLTAEQQGALNAIRSRVEACGFETFLLHGVTGSGKTEVYIRAMEVARSLGRRSLILIPEISLTPQLLDRLSARFATRIGVLHSALTAAERWAHWRRIAHGDIDVVVGARSAVFAPIPNLGLIIVDEEHDSSYKQEEGVRYNGRDVAVVRAKLLDCPVILGSATPALESYENCRQGRYRLLEINRRVEQRPLPRIETIDLRFQPSGAECASKPPATGSLDDSDPARRLISGNFAKALQENLAVRHQTLIFLNRRGFANFLQCSLCGYVWRCPNCSVALTLHLNQRRISCHHCDYRRPTTEICPQCESSTLGAIGTGTERIEQALTRLVPGARVARMDRDTTGRRGSHEQIIRRWEKGEIDILVGTQMVTKGHDVFGVTLVGALLADLSLNLPDFRAAERTFQLLSQVAGRSGRGDHPGRVIIQTYAPDHYAIQHLVSHDYKSFFAAECEFRRALNYPPFTRLVNFRFDGPKSSEVENCSKNLAVRLRELLGNSTKFAAIELLGPAPAPIEKLRNRYRWQLLARSKHSNLLLDFARQARDLMPTSRAVRLHIDVDPYSML